MLRRSAERQQFYSSIKNTIMQTETFRDSLISMPVDTVLETCIEKNITVKEIAEQLELDSFKLRDFIVGRLAINESIAVNLEILLGVDKQFWLNLQANYDKQVKEFEQSIENEKDKRIYELEKELADTKLELEKEIRFGCTMTEKLQEARNCLDG